MVELAGLITLVAAYYSWPGRQVRTFIKGHPDGAYTVVVHLVVAAVMGGIAYLYW